MRRVYLDACVLIYLIEDVGSFSQATRQFFSRNQDALLCVSSLSRLEVLVKLLRESNLTLAADYEDFLALQNWLAIDDHVFGEALDLRVRHGLKSPDALHLATALHHGCDEIWTNDDRLNKAAGDMAVNVLASVATPPV